MSFLTRFTFLAQHHVFYSIQVGPQLDGMCCAVKRGFRADIRPNCVVEVSLPNEEAKGDNNGCLRKAQT